MTTWTKISTRMQWNAEAAPGIRGLFISSPRFLASRKSSCHPLSLVHFLIFKSGPLILQFGCSMQWDGTEDHFVTGTIGNCFSFFRLMIFSSGRYYTRDHFSCLLRVFQACKLRSISRDNRAKTSTFLQGKQ